MLTYCGATDRGERKNNEDAYETTTIEHVNKHFHLLAIADGLGGYAAGEIASRLTIIELRETVKRGLADKKTVSLELIRELLVKGFRKANEEICDQRKIVPERHNMGTTLVVALLNDEGKGFVANVGDSRAYLIGNNIERITRDHSYVQELVEKGIIKEEEAFGHPEKNIVTKIIGMKNVEPDFFEITIGNKILLLCSDGLNDTLKDEKIKEIIINSRKEDICRNLVEAAKSESLDNITVIAAGL